MKINLEMKDRTLVYGTALAAIVLFVMSLASGVTPEPVEPLTQLSVSVDCNGNDCDTTWHYTIITDTEERDYIVHRNDGRLDTVSYLILKQL